MWTRISEQVATDLKQGRSEQSIAEELAASEGWNDETALEFVININLAEVAKHKTKPRHVVLECIAGFGGLLFFFGAVDWIASFFGYDITGVPWSAFVSTALGGLITWLANLFHPKDISLDSL